ncbi:UvrD-helicase domain-containing protein [Elizabethkingia anophelis]|uniref:DNA 3'-5' helicase II n=1 Tax=Elizabethkingia anophelis TaxID=1117645 RepID=A0AAU8UUR9_9FLAO|nr:UvrD-helicase domain-containing protein [Elizabethkingia anophelis]AQX00109.1 DNA helicase II [Elizabethkingia anophelis]MDV3566376.1 DNA helicase II [Elizabethkingia anophelis]MDV3970917.1 DNA helicase II [Elizabethkingia anophelis]OPB65877.1 DNA helicase II [Elizabethkingia anophelis]OPC30882.1 DNA helicase II [Elizabethkingia anophelis]
MENKLIIAAAGSGKTTFLVEQALKQKEGKVLITTYTQANEAEIKKKIIEKNKCIPENVTVQTWFSFLLKHGVRPYQGVIFEKKIKGLILVNSQSGLKAYTKDRQPIYFGEEKEFEQHYFSKELKIYSDKLSKFVFRCNEKSDGLVIDRISRIYSHVFIDEIQDLAGYDLELLKLLFDSKSTILLVGDPRQGTYSTNSAPKNSKFKKANIVNYFLENKAIKIEIDQTSLLTNYRCNKAICDLSNKLFIDFEATTSGNNEITDHDGVFFIKEKDVDSYLHKYQPLQLRDTRKKIVNENYAVMNFGESKGLSFDRVIIYPTKPFLDWLKDSNTELTEISRSKLYVALTRARYSVAIVNNKEKINEDISHYTV